MRKKCDTSATRRDRLLACAKVGDETRKQLRATRAALDPMDPTADIEARLGRIFTIVARVDEDRQDEIERAGKPPGIGTVREACVPASAAPTESLVRTPPKNQNQTKRRVS